MSKSKREITLATIEGCSDQQGQHKIDLRVFHSKGRTNMFTGGAQPAGYCVSVEAYQTSDRSTKILLLDGKGIPSAKIADGERFGAAALKRAAKLVTEPDEAMQAKLARLYDKVLADRPEASFPVSGLGEILRQAKQAV